MERERLGITRLISESIAVLEWALSRENALAPRSVYVTIFGGDKFDRLLRHGPK